MDYQAFIYAFNKLDQFSRNGGIRLLKMGEGFSEAEMEVSSANRNVLGTVHGGALFTLADITAGTSVVSHGSQCVTLSADVHFLRPVLSGTVRAQSREIHYGGSTAVTEVAVTDSTGRLVFSSTVTMFLTGEPVPGAEEMMARLKEASSYE